MQKERRQQTAAMQRARQEQLERSRERAAGRTASLRAGNCPDCGAELQVLQKGYDSGTGLTCCCLAGPIGLLAGLLGSGTKTRVCKGCGHEFRFGSETNVAAIAVATVVAVVVLLVLLRSC